MLGLEREGADAGEGSVGWGEVEFIGGHGLHQRQDLALNGADLLIVDLADGVGGEGGCEHRAGE